MKFLGNINGSNILMLQGPMGTFFQKVESALTSKGAITYKICFNAGDYFFTSKPNRFAYTGDQDQWNQYVKNFLTTNNIEKILLFGNCRFYHKEAIHVAKEMEIEVFVFEEGYIRPNYITLERNGVNGDSTIPRDPQFFIPLDITPSSKPQPVHINHLKMGLSSGLYYLLNVVFRSQFPHYQHHRDPSVLKELGYALRNLIRKPIYRIVEKNYNSLFAGELKKLYYFVPLQTRTDFQIKVYSRYPSIRAFIQEVLLSFAQHSPPDTSLVIKHHPVERGMRTYAKYIAKLSRDYGIENRVLVIYDVHLPTCLKNAIGTVTINSTVGISSLFHNTPTITLGTAVYDIEGLTCRGMNLDTFWKEYKQPDRQLFLKFRSYVIAKTQLNGSFYGKFPDFSD